jgi:hypothetical protein
MLVYCATWDKIQKNLTLSDNAIILSLGRLVSVDWSRFLSFNGESVFEGDERVHSYV